MKLPMFCFTSRHKQLKPFHSVFKTTHIFHSLNEHLTLYIYFTMKPATSYEIPQTLLTTPNTQQDNRPQRFTLACACLVFSFGPTKNSIAILLRHIF